MYGDDFSCFFIMKIKIFTQITNLHNFYSKYVKIPDICKPFAKKLVGCYENENRECDLYDDSLFFEGNTKLVIHIGHDGIGKA